MKQFLILKNLKTLLIDDNVIVRDTLRMIFTQKGCRIKAYETAEEGLEALEEERFDIIISDLQLPGIDGVEFFKRAKRSQPDAVRILISGYGEQSTITESFEIGVQAFIKKPFSLTFFLDQLMPCVEEYHKRISQSRDSTRTEAESANPQKSTTADHDGNSSRLSKPIYAVNLMSCHSPDSKKKTALNASAPFRWRKFRPGQVAV